MAGFNLFVAGELVQRNTISLRTIGKEYAHDDLNLYLSNNLPQPIEDYVGLRVSGEAISVGAMSLYVPSRNQFQPTVGEDGEVEIQDSDFLRLYTHGVENVITTNERPFLNLFLQTEEAPKYYSTNNLSLYLLNSEIEVYSKSNTLNLFTVADTYLIDELSASTNLFIDGYIPKSPLDSSMNLYVHLLTDIETLDNSLSLFVADNNTLRWDSNFPGVNIGPEDEIFTSVPATDSIRGFDLICYGNCSIGTCEDVSIITHDTSWFEPICVDGGIFRANELYTNVEENVFGTDIPYSGHFYGMRKITGLKPLQPYFVNITGMSGSSTRVTAPKELAVWEYTASGTGVAFSGIKIIGDSPNESGIRNPGDRFGTSVDMNQDLLAIGSPYTEIEYEHKIVDTDPTTYTLQDAGSVSLYRRGPEPDFDDIVNSKAPWYFEATLQLPSGIMRDYYIDKEDSQHGVPVTIRNWFAGQEGRNFGSDVHVSITPNIDPWVESDTKQLVAVSGPNASWSRSLEDTGVIENDILLFVFTDEFLPTIDNLTYRNVLDSVLSKNLLYSYYSNPTIALSINIIIFQPIDFDLQENIDFPEPKPSFITKKAITRHRNEAFGSQEYNEIDDELYGQIKDAFEELYPPGASNLPAILGVYVDNSRSLGNAAIEPALSRFKDYYQSYTYNNGLEDYNGIATSGAVIATTSLDENWILQTKSLIDFTLDSGRLVDENFLSLLTDPVTFGQFNDQLEEFNIPPSSGGRVYLFEKENEDWNLIQQIESPTLDNNIPPDLFGKSIDMSEDGTILAIGSPYIDQAISIYEFDPNEKDRLYSNLEDWVDYHLAKDSFSTYYGQIKFNIEYLRGLEEFSNNNSGIYRNLFLNLSHQEKYNYRNDKEYWQTYKKEEVIQEYKKIFDFSYSDIQYQGTYYKLAERFAPTSRMGYSVAVNDSGTSIAIGCPTDSFDENDDTNLYYNPTNSSQVLWPSYVNAGAIRTINAIKYHRHDTVIEYGKFGNKYRKLYEKKNPDQFNHFSGIYFDLEKNYIDQSYEEFDIPDNAGVVYIICPEIDYSNPAVMNRITKWLDLGDRNLVLVGNDGVSENFATFSASNKILNNILEKLNSSMKLFSVPDKQRSLFNSNASCPELPNVIPSNRPDGSIESYIETPQLLSAHGVADIRIGLSGIKKDYSCSQSYIENNDYCSPSFDYGGDLRTQFTDENGTHTWSSVFYENFGNTRTPPVPLLCAAYYKDPIISTIPAVPPSSGLKEFFDIVPNVEDARFGSVSDDTIKFSISEDRPELNNYSDFSLNVASNTNPNRFFNPAPKMISNAILQSKASDGVDSILGIKEVSRPCHFAAEEKIPNSNNKVFLISSLAMETVDILYSGVGDKDINFYFNIVAKNTNGQAFIAQLNEWSGRSNFQEAQDGSILKLVFENTGNTVSTNVSLQSLIFGHPSGSKYDVCWIANPINLPSDEDITELKKWLSRDNRKVVVTYNNDTAAKSAEVLCEKLNLTMKPLYLPNRARFANNKTDIHPDDSRSFYSSRFPTNPIINPENLRIRNGFVASRDSIDRIGLDCGINTFIPIELNQGISVASIPHGLVDDKWFDVDFHYFKTGTAKITFPVESATAYKIFFNTVQYSEYEKEPLYIYITNCTTVPSFTSPSTPPNQDILNMNADNSYTSVFNGPVGLSATIGGKRSGFLDFTNSFNIQTISGAEEISIYIQNNTRTNKTYDNLPSTVGLLSVSGCLLNLVPSSKQVPRYEWVITGEGSPEITSVVEFPDPFPIRSNSTDYCPDGCAEIFENTFIDDGPVVAAQEIYNTDSLQGIEKSRITLISDVSLIAGACIFDEDGEVKENSKVFLQSLYPDTEFPEVKSSKIFRTSSMRKIVPPERTSPARLFQSIGNSGLIERFLPNNNDVVNSGLPLSEFRDAQDVDIASIERPGIADSDLGGLISSFENSQEYYGSNSKFHYEIDGVTYEDATVRGGRPSVMNAFGHDFLDFDFFPSGYPGDLFGYSIDYHRDKLVAGSPFSAYSSNSVYRWSEDVVNSVSEQYALPFGIIASRNGGAGAAYVYYAQLGGNLNYQEKLRPTSIGVGQDLTSEIQSTLTQYLGENSYSLEDLLKYSTTTDQFGYSVKIYSDVIAVGAPGHDYSINADLADAILASGAFSFDHFNYEYDAKPRTLIDLGDPEVREAIGLISGVMNNGAVYTFEHKITNYRTQEKTWELVEKLIPDGYNARLQQGYDEESQVVASGTENEHFGEQIALFRPKRTDADYTIAIGTPHHKFATSGEHPSGDVEDAGAVFLFDAMLRSSPPFVANGDAFMGVDVFGNKRNKLHLDINNSELNKTYNTYGIVSTNNRGEMYIEGSGQDPNIQGFAIHRPVINSVYGRIYEELGSGINDNFNLYIPAVGGITQNNLNMYCSVPNSAYVYNNLNIYVDTTDVTASGLSLFIYVPEGTAHADWVGLHTSGNGDFYDTVNLFSAGY
jgi:hypothetical protein